MTDEQIVKALELESTPSEMNCIYASYIEGCGIYCDKKKCNAENCAGCKEHRMAYGGNRAKAILALIKRQQAEIERLKTDLEAIVTEYEAYKEAVDVALAEARTETVREFAKFLINKAENNLIHIGDLLCYHIIEFIKMTEKEGADNG